MSAQFKRTWDGVTWNDVKARIRALAGLYEYSITVEMSDPPDGTWGPTGGLYWRVVARRRVGESGLYGERGCGHLWPSEKFKSVPELLLDCCNRLERVLQDTAVDSLTGLPLRSYFCPPKVREN